MDDRDFLEHDVLLMSPAISSGQMSDLSVLHDNLSLGGNYMHLVDIGRASG